MLAIKMAEVKELKENEFVFENGIVSVEFGWDYVTGKQVVKRFRYNDVDSDAIQKISKELYSKLKAEVDKFAEKYFEIKKQKELEEQKKLLEEKKKELEDFKRMVMATELVKYSPEFADEEEIKRWSNVKFVRFRVVGGYRVTLEQDKGIWIVSDDSLKSRRYTVFENAINRVKELIMQYTNEYNRKVAKENTLQNFADAVGMKLTTKWVSYSGGRYGEHVPILVPKEKEEYLADYELELKVSDGKASVHGMLIRKPIKFWGRIVSGLTATFKEDLDVEGTKQLIEEIKKAIGEVKINA
jgi:hypothetical protein